MEFLRRNLPILDWLRLYKRHDLAADTVAGVVVLFITVPQVIAYAFLAGLPAEAGLYAAILALVCYAVFGSSRTLAVGPTAIIAMMTLEATSAYYAPGTIGYGMIAMKLGWLTGMILLLLRIVNFGAVLSFLSHAVVTGFITAAAILIVTNQLPAILGIGAAPETDVLSVLNHVLQGASSLNPIGFVVGLATMLLLLFARTALEPLLLKAGLSPLWRSAICKSAPMYAVVVSIACVYQFSWHDQAQVAVVGHIPTNLPDLRLFVLTLEEVRLLVPSALLIAMVVFMESTSIGSAVASKRREKIAPNKELVGLGVANIGAAIAGGFPVAGSFARTMVNFSSGAVTQVASLITAFLVVVTLVWLTPLFYYLPKSVLSAIIVMSAIQLIDWANIRRIYAFNKTDAVTFAFTFLAVLALGVESGILVGIVISFVLLIRSSSRPHIAVVGRWRDSEHFRNVERYDDVKQVDGVLAIRIDESLYFVNTRFIETYILNRLADDDSIRHLLLICTSVNFIDTSGLEMLELLVSNLEEVGVTLHLAEVKGPVMDKLKHTDFCEHMHGEVFFTTDIAMKQLAPTFRKA